MILDVRQITAFGDSSTFYVRNGDWFVILCAAFVLGTLLSQAEFDRKWRQKQTVRCSLNLCALLPTYHLLTTNLNSLAVIKARQLN